MNTQFDELIKSMAEATTRRGALRKFGAGIAGMTLACFGLANKSQAQTGCFPAGYTCNNNNDCCSGLCKPTGKSGFPKHKACY